MKSPSNFIIKIFRNNKTIKISTLSPNEQFFYKIKEPKDLYWGLLCSPIAFFDIFGNLIYFNKAQYAQLGLTKTKKWEVVSWSISGNFAFFIERDSPESLQYVLLDLVNRVVNKTCFQNIDKNKRNTDLVRQLEKGGFDEKIISTTEFDNFTSIIPDKLQKGILEIFGFNNWRPTMKEK